MYQDGNYLYPGQYSQTITDRMILPLGREHYSWKAGPGEVMTVENKQKMVLYQSILTTLFYSRLYLHRYSYLEELCEWCFSVLKIVRCRLVKWSRAMIFACCSTTIFNPIRNLCNYCTRSTLIASKQSR